MSVAEFREWHPGDVSGRRWQLVDGELVAMAPASENHGAIRSELARLLANHLIARDSPCRVITEPGIIPRVRASENWRIPDLGITCAPARGTIEVSEPVLLAEILSPNNHAETRANIWAYTTVTSVKEILVIHATRIEVEVLRRQADAAWPEQPLIVRDGEAVTLDSIALTLPVRAFYRTTSLVL